nr:hypothetical protein [Tanacetum cinerariifolium]
FNVIYKFSDVTLTQILEALAYRVKEFKIKQLNPGLRKKYRLSLKNDMPLGYKTTLLDDALPTKEKDPRSFTLPCNINNFCFNKALADLGASVSLMPFLTYTILGLGELAPTMLIVELAYRTMKHPKGIAENVLVRIDKFVFPVDFVLLGMAKDIRTPLILGRRFLSSTHAKIHVFNRKKL